MLAIGYSRQHRVAAGAGAGDRHRGRRRHRRGRERRARDRGGARALDPGRRPRRRWREITGPIIAITLVLLSVFVPVAFIPGISGQLFRQFAVAVSVSMLISALNALTLSPALCAVLLKRGQTQPRADALRAGRRSTGCATAMSRWCAGWCGSRSSASWWWPASLAASVVPVQARRRRASCPRRTRARFFAAMRLPEGASINRTEAVVQAGRGHHPADPRRRGRAVGGRAQLHRLRRLVEPGLLRHPPQALRGAHRPRAERRRHHRAAAAAARGDPGRHRLSRSTCRRSSASAAPAASSTCSRRCRASRRPISRRRCAACSSRPTSSPSSPACSAPMPPTRRRSISTSTATRRRCWASRSATSSTRCNRRSAASTSTTSTCSAAPGRSTSRPRRRSATAIDDIYRIYVRNAHGAMVPIRALAQARLVQGPQAVIRYNGFRARDHQRRAEARLQLGPGARRDGAHLRHDAARRLRLRMDRHRAAGKGGGRPDRHRARRSPCCSPISSWSRSTRAGTSRCRCCCRSASACWARSPRVALAGAELRRLCPDRPRRADRARRQERHPDRRVRGRAARARQGRSMQSAIEGARPALPPGDDDQLRLHPRACCRWSSPRAPARSRRRAVGTPVFGGMIAASLFGIFVIPMLYITAERLRRQAPRQTPK